jgi:hypothetical protein
VRQLDQIHLIALKNNQQKYRAALHSFDVEHVHTAVILEMLSVAQLVTKRSVFR